MTDGEIVDALQRGRADGADCLWLGGGEPTLRKDLFRIAALGRRLGYGRVKLQTNGMMLAYPEYARRCAEAGITEVAFSLKGANAATHDRITRTAGCFDLMARGVERARAAGLGLEGDLLVTTSNTPELPAMVSLGVDWGMRRFRVWLLSATDATRDDPAVRAEVPRMRDVVPGLAAAQAQQSAKPTYVDTFFALHEHGLPADIESWKAMQTVYFGGHPRLLRGWIRCWSKTRLVAFYFRLSDGFSTFEWSDMKAVGSFTQGLP